jgi:hypothetical protein
MRRSIVAAASIAAVASLAAYTGASAQGVGVEIYVGPPASYYYGPAPYVAYDYAPDADSYYAPGITVYRRRGGDPSPNRTRAYFDKLDREGRGGNAGN